MSEGHDDRESGEPSDAGARADSGERVDDPFESLPEADGEDPFEWLDSGADLGERTPAEATALFEAVDVGVDLTETPWEHLVSADFAADGIDPTTVGEVVVPKRRYCQKCEYFADPPEVACTHPDGEVLEVTDVTHFRVRNCPVVAYRRGHAAYDGPEIGADD